VPDNSVELIRLQMAMAFGQGAGSMLASHDALEFLLTGQAGVIEGAAKDWKASRFAFIELVRVLGQVAATNAAVDKVWEIERRHVEQALPAAFGPCPCLDMIRPPR
jgi:hypothetical protein